MTPVSPFADADNATAMSFGAPHRHYRRTDSTNARAKPVGRSRRAARHRRHRGGADRGARAAGPGLDRPSRQSPPLLGDPPPARRAPLLLPLAAAARRLRGGRGAAAPGVECGVKWPNDVLLDGRKLAGVLIEARPQNGWAVIGVGLNLSIAPEEFPPDLRDTAARSSLDRIWSPEPPDAGGTPATRSRSRS